MPAKSRQSQHLNRLAELAHAPQEQAVYALNLLEKERNQQVILAALHALAEYPEPGMRPVLLRQYAHYAEDGVTRDPGTYIRAAILRVLRQLVHPDDKPLLERATATYEFLPPGRSEEGGQLRSAALIALDEIDRELAGYHCVRLLIDQYTSKMSGEPAVTAVRVLAAQGQFLPLYNYAFHYGKLGGDVQSSDALAECLKNLISAPPSIFLDIVNLYRNSQDEIALIGLFELILGHPACDAVMDFVRGFLATTRVYNAYHYLATLMATSRDKDLLAELLRVAKDERDPRKVQHLVEALTLVQGNTAAMTVVDELRKRIR